jgi:hypothetical protein
MRQTTDRHGQARVGCICRAAQTSEGRSFHPIIIRIAEVSFPKFPGIGTKRRERNWEGSGRVSKRPVFIGEYWDFKLPDDRKRAGNEMLFFGLRSQGERVDRMDRISEWVPGFDFGI